MAPSYAEIAKELERKEHPDDRAKAAERLAELGLGGGPEEPIIIPAIGKNLDDSNWRVRKAAADALATLSTYSVWGRTATCTARRTIPELMARLGDEDCRVRRACMAPLERIRTCGKLGEANDLALLAGSAIPLLIQRMKDDDWRVREASVRAFGDLDCSSALPAVPILAAHLADTGDRVRTAARSVLEKLHASGAMAHVSMYGADAVPDLTDALSDNDWRVRCAATWALGQVGGCHAVGAEQLQKDLSDADWCVRLLAVQALGEVGFSGMAAIPDIALRRMDDHEPVREAARIALAKQSAALHRRSPPATALVHQLARKMESRKANERKEALESLGELGYEALPAVPDIMRRLMDKSADVSVAADVALTKLGKARVFGSIGIPPPPGTTSCGREMKTRPRPKMVEKLILCLDEENWAVRLGAAEGLATLAIRASFVIPKLTQTREEEHLDHHMSNSARRMLDRFEEQGAMTDINKALCDAVPELLERREDQDETVAAMARDTIERLVQSGLLNHNPDNMDNLQDEPSAEAVAVPLESVAEDNEPDLLFSTETEEQEDNILYSTEKEEEMRRAAEEALAEQRPDTESSDHHHLTGAQLAAQRAKDPAKPQSEEKQHETVFNCDSCQREIKEMSKFCGKCGRKRPISGWSSHSEHSSLASPPPTPPRTGSKAITFEE